MKLLHSLLCFFLLTASFGWTNQTDETTPILPGDELPFTVELKPVNNFNLPNGFHSGVEAIYEGKWLMFGGRVNGMHGFFSDNSTPNFPPQMQNDMVYVIDPSTWQIWSRSLNDTASGLNSDEIDSLMATSPQSYQQGKQLYITGGYGYDRNQEEYVTWNRLTIVDVPGLMNWVMNPFIPRYAKSSIRQLQNDFFKVTGGYMTRIRGKKENPFLLIFGQDFEGAYADKIGVKQEYTEEIRRFYINDDGKNIKVTALQSMINDDFHRRDLNVAPVIRWSNNKWVRELVAYSGVFYPKDDGIWTVPVMIKANGEYSIPNPKNPDTFKQGMNNYVCATIPMFSKKNEKMYTLFFGGLSYCYFKDGEFIQDSDIPYINQITTIQIDKEGNFSQYLMDNTFPTIRGPNRVKVNLFGTGAQFFPKGNFFDQDILKFDALKSTKPHHVGYIVGGIGSAVANTSDDQFSNTFASYYLFEVWITPK